ncbi:MAG: hypothetical protein HC877_13690 [Thioploca sp.]|nr:hypothetical protein [Thioploca sp.]
MRYVHSQSGAALIILLTIFILGSITFLLSQLNERAHYLLEDQDQTIQALNQAKESLLGFAATYAQNHDVKLQGYLPCPDRDGNGSLEARNAELTCDKEGIIVTGRFPWRTLGVPPLRDGSGECLWYAVSGNFKNNPKQVLTSDSYGQIVIRDAKNEIITGQPILDKNGQPIVNQDGKPTFDGAIAVIFAPGRLTKNQTRDVGTGTLTECGSTIAGSIIEPINQTRNYLDQYNYEGVVIDNPSANGAIFISPSSGFFASSPLIDVIPEFINAPPVYETYLHPQDDTEQLDRANPTFNDTLITITSEDFKPVYRMMDYQVATQVRACLDRYAQQSFYQFMDTMATDIDSITEQKKSFITEFIESVNKIDNYLDKTTDKEGILVQIKNNVKDKNILYPKYPWTTKELKIGNLEINQGYFGRISNDPIRDEPIDLSSTKYSLKNYLLQYIVQKPNLSQNQIDNLPKLPGIFDTTWENFKTQFAAIPNKWPVDPQTPFLILDLHDLEYETLKKDPQVTKEELIARVLDTLKDKDIKQEFIDFYKLDDPKLDDPTAQIKNISSKEDLIDKIKAISKRTSVQQELQRYQCFYFTENPAPSTSKWWWWQAWQDKVFFAIHSDYSLNNSTIRDLTFNTPAEQDDIIHAEMLVLVAGRSLNGQQRFQPEQQIEITNYLEGENSNGDTRFKHAPVTSTFNDVVL